MATQWKPLQRPRCGGKIRMKVVVTGAAGYIGSQTCKTLMLAGHEVIGVDRHKPRHDYYTVFHDDRDYNDIQDLLLGVDACVHIAATSLVGPSMTDPFGYYQNNTQGTLALMHDCKIQNVNTFVFASSAACYGEVDDGICRVTDKNEPTNPYGYSKRMTEVMLNDFARAYGMNSVSLRFFNVAGADSDGEMGQEKAATHIIARVMESAIAEETFTFFGNNYPTPDGTCIRDYIHVEDIASGIKCSLDFLKDNTGAHIFNLGSGQGNSNKEIVDAVALQTPLMVKTAFAEARAGDPAILVADTKETEKLGWVPEHGLDSIVYTAYNWYMKTKKASTPNEVRDAYLHSTTTSTS
jgi:UDP-glucose 4-epimerase